jgi:hypothetical protein
VYICMYVCVYTVCTVYVYCSGPIGMRRFSDSLPKLSRYMYCWRVSRAMVRGHAHASQRGHLVPVLLALFAHYLLTYLLTYLLYTVYFMSEVK